jgi:hypothetical protein
MGVHVMSKFLIAAALAAAATASPVSAAVTVLDFGGDACVDVVCSSAAVIRQSYGDGPGVDVSYATYNYPAGSLNVAELRYWGVGYGDLSGVVWGGNNGFDYSSRITLTALPGYEISLLSFDIATYLGASGHSPVTIESLGGDGILAADIATLSPAHNHVDVGSGYFADGIALNWGPDGYNVGLDNITFDVRALGGIPEPEAWTMMILGLGAAGSLIRRRRALTA